MKLSPSILVFPFSNAVVSDYFADVDANEKRLRYESDVDLVIYPTDINIYNDIKNTYMLHVVL